MKSVLVVSTLAEGISNVRKGFGKDVRVALVSEMGQALGVCEHSGCDLVFVDLDILTAFAGERTPEIVLQAVRQQIPSAELIVMAAADKIRQAVAWIKAGAGDYITYPVSQDQVKLVAETVQRPVTHPGGSHCEPEPFRRVEAADVIATKSPVMAGVYKKVCSVAATRTIVLLSGETGTGKSVFARLIHQYSNRRDAQFVSVHCGAIPDSLLESELFGHEKGAFTGAIRKKLGKFEIAGGGTIFLDEIDTLTPPAQIKLLQVLQDGTFNRVGGEETIATNARVVAATNADLKKLSEEGLFRKDLYYRLNVFPIEIPPLRDRVEDIPHLVDLFLRRLNAELTKSIHKIDPVVVKGLMNYEWPGNVRELENLVERACILETSAILTTEGFPRELFETLPTPDPVGVDSRFPLAQARKSVMEAFERRYIKDLIDRNQGRINVSAAAAGITPRQLHKLMRRYGIRKEDSKTRQAADQNKLA